MKAPARSFAATARTCWLIVASIILLLSSSSPAQITITLKNTFIEKYKNLATIDATFTVDKAHARPNPPAKDSDIHIAGRAPEVGLPMVAEIMNAASQPAAVDLIHQIEGSDRTVAMTGAWRLWCEHGGSSEQVQGAKLAKFTTTNPDHVFEIHPITKLGDSSLSETLHGIEGFQPKDAFQAFLSYENKKSQISVGPKTTTIVTTMGGFNYVAFIMEITGDQLEVPDGRFMMAKVHDLEGEVLVHNRRMVFIKNTPPEQLVHNMAKGSCLSVLGIPRIDLAVISWRTHNARTRPGVLTWTLPYEMVIVAAQRTDCSGE
jgi:hypothetical protein